MRNFDTEIASHINLLKAHNSLVKAPAGYSSCGREATALNLNLRIQSNKCVASGMHFQWTVTVITGSPCKKINAYTATANALDATKHTHLRRSLWAGLGACLGRHTPIPHDPQQDVPYGTSWRTLFLGSNLHTCRRRPGGRARRMPVGTHRFHTVPRDDVPYGTSSVQA